MSTEITETKKVGRRTLLTPEVQKAVVAFTRAGGFAWAAAAAAGIAPNTYGLWMSRGKVASEAAEEAEEELTDIYGLFYREVYMARAQARIKMETAVAVANPLAWLRYGPGRDRPGEPGWTDSTKVELSGPNGGPLTMAAARPMDLSKLSAKELDDLERLTSKALDVGDPAFGAGGEGST